MGLVDYGSDSDSDTPAPAPVAAPAPVPRKAKKPVRIVAPSTSTTATDDGEPAAKKPRFTLGGAGGPSGKAGGFLSSLPAPKNASSSMMMGLPPPKNQTPAATAPAATPASEASTMFVPHRVGTKPATKPVAVEAAKDEEDEEEEEPAAPAVDFFGIGSTTTTSSSSRPSSAAPPKAVASSAPVLAAPAARVSTFGATPTAEDPYPGFFLSPNGTWIAKDRESYEAYLRSIGVDPASAPSYDQYSSGGAAPEDDLQEVSARDVHTSTYAPPSAAAKATQAPPPPVQGGQKMAGGRAKSRHQLSTMIQEAQMNRHELEERIAQAKVARKGAGSKYGF